MIKISASLLKDILSCTQRGYYRVFYPEQSIETKEMAIGTVVHHAIENHWDNEDLAIEYARGFASKRELNTEDVTKHVKSFFNNFYSMCSVDDLAEHQFCVPLFDDVVLVGKIDRIDRKSGIVYDWKTTKDKNVPRTPIINDIQFIVYHYAYKRLFGSEPNAVLYASLTTGKLIPFIKVDSIYNSVFDEVIPRVVDTIKSGQHSRDGLYGMFDPKNNMSYSCFYCAFRDFCWREIED